MSSTPAPVSPPDQEVAVAAATLLTDIHGAEVRAAFLMAGVPCMLLKGRAFADLLYFREPRFYSDTDLLVPADRRPRAEHVLQHLGFENLTVEAHHQEPLPLHAHQWFRARDGASLDLHWSVFGSQAHPDQVWAVHRRHISHSVVGGLVAEVPDEAASASLCALHLAAHGPFCATPLEDLERAIATLTLATWRDAYTIACEIDAEDAFRAGLGFAPSGPRLANTLGLRATTSARHVLMADHRAPPGARAVARVLAQPTLRARVRVLSQVLVPNVEDMRARRPLARRGQAGLVASHGLRLSRIFVLTPGAILTWRRARKRAQDHD